jgi:hypothetical protein
MPTLKGKWYFKEVLQVNTNFSQSINYEITDNGTIIMQAIGMCMANGALEYETEQSILEVYSYVHYWGGLITYRSIDFGETPQEVSEEFYNWFTKNAVNLQPTGTWRFNKTLTCPGTYLYSHARGDAVIGTAHDTETGSSQITQIGYDPSIYLAVYDIEGDGYNIWYDGSWYSEEARLITFIDKNLMPLNPEFALWFYENAFPMDLTFCSECYIAEIADTIRQIKGTTQKYAVKSLADEITTLYECANEEVY